VAFGSRGGLVCAARATHNGGDAMKAALDILLVDDEEDIRVIARMVLERIGGEGDGPFRALGAKGVIHKPFDPSRLSAEVERTLGNEYAGT
jgi:hypothetical protein